MTLSWSRDLPAEIWDRHLAEMGGHPLQSALWGTSRARVDGIADIRFSATAEGKTVLLARCEIRTIARLARIAWIPRGPVLQAGEAGRTAFNELLHRLRVQGFLLCIDDRYEEAGETPPSGAPLSPAPRTAVIDLTIGRDRIWNAIDSQWRYGVRSAARSGVVVDQTRDPKDIETFFLVCREISERKGFDLPGSLDLLTALLSSLASDDVDARLFAARLGSDLVAGAVVLRSGSSLHYFWGGVDRRFPKQRAGEAVQWAVIEWALNHGLARYDLEGIDAVANPGTYKFKLKMGASEVRLRGRRGYPLNVAGRFAMSVGRWTGRL